MKKYIALPNVQLLLALVALVVLYPFLERLQSGRVAVIAFDWAILALALRSAKSTGVQTNLGYALLLPTIVLQATGALTGEGGIHVVVLLFQAALHAFVIVCLFRYVLSDEIMTLDELFAAGSLYAMLAFVFAYLYSVVEYLVPGSFYINASNNPDGIFSWFEMLYFSFTCLTSVGFGEITPVSDHARSMVMIQQLIGVLYLAIVISRLISMQARRGK
ncbi:MAG: potassium channel family protein [Arenimonas sp.]